VPVGRSEAITPSALARCALLIVTALILQVSIVDEIRVSGAHPDLMLLLSVAGGYVAGPQRGAGFGFAVGLATDLLLPTTFGLSALVGCLVGFGVGLATTGLERGSWVLPPLIFAVATAAGLTGYAILGAVLGEPHLVSAALPDALAVSVPFAVILAVPVLRAVAWALPAPLPSEGARPGSAR
jgi:rod shape-determining protein MreD